MEQTMKWIRPVATAAHVITGILKVLSVIGAVGLLVTLLLCSFLPGDFLTVEVESALTVHINMRAVMGELWEEQKGLLENQPESSVTVTEDGVEIQEPGLTQTVTGRSFSVSVVPMFVELTLAFLLYRSLNRAFSCWKDGNTPFPEGVGQPLRHAGIFLMIYTAVPSFCAGIMEALTGVSLVDSSFDWMMVLWGFVLIALSYAFEYGHALEKGRKEGDQASENSQDF